MLIGERGLASTVLICDQDVFRLGEEAQRFVAPKAFRADADVDPASFFSETALVAHVICI